MKTARLVVLMLLVWVGSAFAQYNGGYTIITPGQMPTFATLTVSEVIRR
jgi:hypothetical protein